MTLYGRYTMALTFENLTMVKMGTSGLAEEREREIYFIGTQFSNLYSISKH